MKTALVAGATGLVGEELVRLLISDNYYDKIKILSRKPIDYHNVRVMNLLVPDFEKLNELGDELSADDVYCCLGTTIKKAGNKENFRKVDYQFPVDLANLAIKNGAQCFLLVSAMGADPNSTFFYNQVKGDLEQELKGKPFDRLLIFRPSLLLGKRQEKRIAEDISQKIFPLLSPFMVGSLKKFRAIKASDVAAGMVSAAKQFKKGIHVFDSGEIKRLADKIAPGQ
jgi:uncharacterized protein YbjT (DUF2867 family)